MSERLRESVSALMDGEADELELRRLLADSESEADAIDKTWARYHMIQDVLHGAEQDLSFQQLDISSQVRAAISNEPLLAKAEKPVSSWLKPVAGFAVAASVAMAVVVGVQQINPVNPGVNSAVNSAPVLASRVYPVQGSSLQASESTAAVTYQNSPLPGDIAVSRQVAEREVQQRLEKYMLRHTEQAVLNNGQGMMSFARVANLEID